MEIVLDKVSKRYQKYWIFRNVDYRFAQGGRYAILGPNGSGKSTLLRIMCGMLAPSAGKVFWEIESGKVIDSSGIFKNVSFCSPGLELVEEMNLEEFLQFHFSFKTMTPGLSIKELIELSGLGASKTKLIADYSSGMKQRVKLIQAIFSDVPVLLLDEPCTNLDQKGVDEYNAWIQAYCRHKTVIVASNDAKEYGFCNTLLDINNYKTS